jgi:hypothetical protein
MITFKEYLLEQPSMDGETKETSSGMASALRANIQSMNHKNATHIGNGNYHLPAANGAHVYFHKHLGKVREFSYITKDGTHQATDKADGNVEHIHHFMKHHAEHHGPVKTYTTNSKGAVKLWSGLIKTKPKNKTFHVVDSKTNTETHVDHSNIDEKTPSIWGEDHKHITLEMRNSK